MKDYRHEYICTSERGLVDCVEDEMDNVWLSNEEYKAGDRFKDSDGLWWYVVEVIK